MLATTTYAIARLADMSPENFVPSDALFGDLIDLLGTDNDTVLSSLLLLTAGNYVKLLDHPHGIQLTPTGSSYIMEALAKPACPQVAALDDCLATLAKIWARPCECDEGWED